MEYIELLDQLEDYFRTGETKEEKLGIEIEHFVVDQDTLETITYQEENGIEDLLYNLQDKGWQGVEEAGHLIKLYSDQADITLEPGGQLEIGIYPCEKINQLEEIYFNFLADLIPILEEYNYYLVTLGYQPESEIADIAWNPKRRYKIMSNYFQEKGNYAHNMMKGTAAFQIALDYRNQADFVKKFKVASVLSPVLGILVDNAPVFEGEIYERQALRTLIWNNTDQTRTGIVNKSLVSDFNYRKYAEYILTREPILIKQGASYQATGDQTNREIFANQELDQQQLEHILTMVFPDVRAKQFIEVRMADSLPPKLSFALVAFWKGLFYDQTSLQQVTDIVDQFSLADVLTAKEDIIQEGLEAQLGKQSILEVAQEVLKLAQAGLEEEEVNYLTPLQQLVEEERTYASKLKERLEDYSKEEAIKEVIINDKVDY